jgi:hypothetical protein
MSFQDKPIQCSDCGTTFIFSSAQKELFDSKGYTDEPKRCPWCRAVRKMERFGDGYYTYRSGPLR